MSEQFAFDEGFGNGGGIDGDERFTFATAQAVDALCHDLFPRTALSGDHHGNIALGDAFNERKHFAHRFAGTDKIARDPFGFYSRRQSLRLPSQLDLAFGVVEQRLQFRKIGQRFCEKIARPLLHGFHRHIDATLSGDQQDGPVRIAGFQIA